jgi:predicted transposase YdaD
MRYILEVNSHLQPEALQALMEREIGPQAKDIVVTAGQQLIEQGRQEGRLEGRQEGRQEGRLEGRQEGRQEGRLEGRQEGRVEGFLSGERASLLRLLRRRFGNEVDAHVEQRVATAWLEQIEIWTDRVLSAATLAQIFAD